MYLVSGNASPQLTTPDDDSTALHTTDGALGTTATAMDIDQAPPSEAPSSGAVDLIGDEARDMPLNVQQQRTRAAVEKALGYRFKNPQLLFQALTHPSCHSSGGSYQRLEYLGDAVLDLMIMHRACQRFLYVPPC